MVKTKILWTVVAATLWLGGAPGTGAGQQAGESSPHYLQAAPDVIQGWRQLKFGLFIHWGPVSLTGEEIGWSRGGERRGRNDKKTGPTPVEVYDNLYKRFNPVNFRAREWAAVAKAAGMRYMVFTTKHHDGFCNFDSKLTDYKITSPDSPYGKDIVRPLAEACRESGLKWGIYYSPPDWHHPDYRSGARHAQYIEYLHGQLRELLTNYGRVDIMWFDGLRGTAADWDSERLFQMIRQLQPGIIINNRAGLPADFDTPEQRIGTMQIDRPWETCMTIGRQWAWKPDDQLKSLEECIRTLVSVVGGDGNLLFNVGPMPDGRIEPRQAERLRDMGRWLERYGESIYGTRGGPFPRGEWGASTYRDNLVYLHILEWKTDSIQLPPIPQKIVESSLLTGGTVQVKQQGSGALEISVPREHRRQIDTIVKLRMVSGRKY